MILTNCAACAAPLAHNAPRCVMLVMQGNLACTYYMLGRHEEALQIERVVYSGRLRLLGEENVETLQAAINYMTSLMNLDRFEEVKSLMHKSIPIARRVLGESDEVTLKMRWICGQSLYRDNGATLDDLREAVTTLEETERIAKRVLGGAHPTTASIDYHLQEAGKALRAREAPSEST